MDGEGSKDFYKDYVGKYVKVVYKDGDMNIVARGKILAINNLHLQMTDLNQKLPILVLLENVISVKESTDLSLQRRLGQDGQY